MAFTREGGDPELGEEDLGSRRIHMAMGAGHHALPVCAHSVSELVNVTLISSSPGR